MSVDENKEVSRRYHDLKPEEMDEIITQDFIGRGPKGFTWTLQAHKEYWEKNPGQAHDTIHEQVAEGNLVATRFTREGTQDGNPSKGDFMSFKRLQDGKIAEIWELWVVQEAQST